jgi:uncharacterized tellurite resistance protein B-like protein
MGWRGTLRAVEAASRRAERDSQRRYRQLLRDEKERAKTQAHQQAAHEVDVYENQIERLLSVHKEAPGSWDWNTIYNTPPPIEPERSDTQEQRAMAELSSFKPGFLDNLLNRAWKKRYALECAVERARGEDEQQFQRLCQEYSQRHTDWDERRQLAWRILQGDTQAYVDALSDYNPFADITDMGASIEFEADSAEFVSLRVTTKGESLIPEQIKSLTSTGKLSAKPMPKTQSHEIFKEFVCGTTLRIGRELFAFLPAQTVSVTILADRVNTRTGRQGLDPVLSTIMTRKIFDELNFNRLDPADAMENFAHRMDFSKSSGFAAIDPLVNPKIVTATPLTPNLAPVPPQSEPGPSPRSASILSDPRAAASKGQFEQLLEPNAADGSLRLSATALANIMGVTQETKLTLRLSRHIAEWAQNAGYCVEPDARFCSHAYEWNQTLAVFKPPETEPVVPSAAYVGAANLLRLCVVIAAADGHVDPKGLDAFRNVLEQQLHFNQTDLKRLHALEDLLVQDSSSAGKDLTRVAKSIPPEKRLWICKVLVRLAAVDHVITKGEFGALERIFRAFELPREAMDKLIREVCPPAEEISIQGPGAGPEGERIPSPPGAKLSQGFAINMSRVHAIANETREVIELLSVVMKDEEQAVALPRNGSTPSAIASFTPEAAPADSRMEATRFNGLDPTYHPLLERLLARDSWPRSEFCALASEVHLMPLKVCDTINEWADDALGDFLLEGEDPVTIRRSLILK